MTGYQLDIYTLDGADLLVEAAPFKSARIVWAADGPGALEVNLRPSDLAAGDWAWGKRRILLKNPDEEYEWAGLLQRLERDGKPSQGPKGLQYRAAGLGLASMLEKRTIIGDTTFVEKTADNIVAGLLAHLSAQAYDQTGFTLGTVTGVPDSFTRYYCDGDVVKDLIDELANREGGFGWEITPAGKLNMKVGGLGTDLSDTYTLDDTQVIDWQVTGDMEGFATYVLGIGEANDDTPCGPPLIETFHAMREDYGRVQAVTASGGSTSEADMLDIAEEELRSRVASWINVRAAWIEGRGPWAFGAVGIGDRIEVDTGDEFAGTIDMRCIGLSLSLEPGRHEFVEIELEAA
jgi:hypothetical protein